MILLIVRPDGWNLPLLLHVGGKRLGARTLLYAAIPSYFVMRIAAQWIESREGLGNSNAAWLGDGYLAADLGGLLLLIATIAANLAVRRGPDSGLGKLAKLGAGLSLILVALYVFAVWAMTTKPS